ncbi:hypothetical protein AQUCO_03400114v1 [Aquilegia coerulea]|uniref:non-specific serine/threonine protein kinase n=1 Tax=Aquilegia coerulea TaxID=218851 RepID=A0A2G5CXK4_AQUCA|nr:hypothetical protein AQUCO_03400114v1 [Aquilegia coerulea]
MAPLVNELISFIVVIINLFVFNNLLVVASASCYYGGNDYYRCPNGNEVQIRYPFWYQNQENSSDISYCGYPELEIKCGDEDGKPFMNMSNHVYNVQNITYDTKILRLVDVDVDRQECPHPRRNVSLESTPLLDYVHYVYFNWTIFYNCSGYPNYTDVGQYHLSCLDKPTTGRRSYAFPYKEYIPKTFDWYGNCEETVLAPLSIYHAFNFTRSAKFGFDLLWSAPTNNECEDCERSGMATGLKIIIGVSIGIVGIFLILLLVYGRTLYSFYCSTISGWKNKAKIATNVEVLLESYGGPALQRYKYSDIKKMTNFFKDTLGQGGYGCVFKGTLSDDGHLVAVKVLKEPKGDGEEFINEVATIGRTNHVNVVSLLGFCTEGTKRALVYEFMPNGSLERFIYSDKTPGTSTTTLGWDNLYQIALGIARGLEYLHCRCNTRILHFDIKPHNILLDKDFCPKISDFGLAKLCPTKESIVSMVGARGTMGYIAPEICFRNLGGVSHKSDVYSYGMMVLEMIGGRKNFDVTVKNTSEIYFPHWIYNHLMQDFNVEGPKVITAEDSEETFMVETAKKMIIVALWCIQTHPTNRPSMTKVVEMLEGSNEELQMPPNPSLHLSSSATFSSRS